MAQSYHSPDYTSRRHSHSAQTTTALDPGDPSSFIFAPQPAADPPPHRPSSPSFDIFEWHPKYASCQRYFLNHAQHSAPVQAVASFLNILLPFQRHPPTHSTSPANTTPLRTTSSSYAAPAGGSPFHPLPSTSLTPYLRRLVATGLDYPGVLHGFFGDDWVAGIGPLHEQERRNYLFAAKSGGWKFVKQDYDMGPMETVPFLRPLQNAGGLEVEGAERAWSEWLLMEDWMVGPRAPAEEGSDGAREAGEPDMSGGMGRGGRHGHGMPGSSRDVASPVTEAMRDYDEERGEEV
jgi:hypothetical protein